MPLTGLIDERAKEFTWKQILKGKGDFSDPRPLLLSLYQDRTDYADFSVTELMNDPYQLQMERRFDYFESPDSIQDRMFGTAIHKLIEDADNTGNIEVRVITPFMMGGREYTVGGTVDYIDIDTIWDYKTVTMGKLRMMNKGKIDAMKQYEQQLNAYRWLLWKGPEIKIRKLKVRMLVRDWRFYEFRKSGFNPQQYPRGCIVPIRMWGIRETEKWIRDRLKIHVKASRLDDEKLAEIGECDTWGGLRCNHYCAMKSVCHFRLNDKENGSEVKQP